MVGVKGFVWIIWLSTSNKVIVLDKFPIPMIEELMDEIHGAKYLSRVYSGQFRQTNNKMKICNMKFHVCLKENYTQQSRLFINVTCIFLGERNKNIKKNWSVDEMGNTAGNSHTQLQFRHYKT